MTQLDPLIEIADQFQVDGRIESVTETGGGKINDTYVVRYRGGSGPDSFILQRLNLKVFPSPEAVMHNIRAVTEHMENRLNAADESSFKRKWQVPLVIPGRNGEDFLLNEEGECWRALTRVVGASAYEEARSPEDAHEAGVVLGWFHEAIADMCQSDLTDTLPGYHIMPGYLRKLDAAAGGETGKGELADPVAEDCLRFIEERREWSGLLEAAKERGELVHRPIHGDPKISNVMFDNETGRGVGIVDLDTVKPGLIHYDFGDCLRSCCNPAGEETRDLNEVGFDAGLCDAIVRGYMRSAGSILTEADRRYLFDSIRLISFELGVRYFADHLAGDVYFKSFREGHNLDRARVQFHLCASIEEKEDEIRGILERHW